MAGRIHTDAGHLCLQLVERNTEILGNVQGGDELAVILESALRGLQIHAFGQDPLSSRDCKGSMSAEIEAAE